MRLVITLLLATAPLSSSWESCGNGFCCDNSAWETGFECVNKPSESGTELSATTQHDCVHACAEHGASLPTTTGKVCCFWQSDTATCKLFTDYSGTANPASGGGRFSLTCAGSADTTPPTLTTGVSAAGANGATFSATSSEDGTVYYATLLKTDAAPSATAIKDQSAGAIAGGKGASVVTANTAAAAALTERLNPGTPYVVYAVAADAAGTMGAVVATEFTPSDLPRAKRVRRRASIRCSVTSCGTCSDDFDFQPGSIVFTCKDRCAPRYKCCENDGQRCVPSSSSLYNCESPPDSGSGTCNGFHAYCKTLGHRCIKLHSDKCPSRSARKCDSCTNGNWYLSADKQSCVMSCPDGSWATRPGGIRYCTACDVTDCNICTGAASCTQCKNSKYYTGGGDTSRPWKDATCTTSCAAGRYAGSFGTGTGAIGRTCSACFTDCHSCTDGVACTECGNFKYLAVGGGACVTTCPAGTFPAGTGVTGRTCTCDVTSCGTCSEVGKCDSCTDGTYLVVDKTSCLAACPATVTTELLKDIRVGAGGSGPFKLTVVGETLYFYADDGIHGWELWKSDGTAAGTVLLKDINPGKYEAAHITWDWNKGSFSNGANPGPFVAMGGTIYFYAYDDAHGGELWKSDGTAAGTVIVKDINTKPSGDGTATKASTMCCLTAVGTTLYFSADDGIHGNELWKSDGTAAGTVMVKDINFGETIYGAKPSSSNPGKRQGEEPEVFAAIGNTIYFMAQSGSKTAPKLGNELWKSDGTEAGTVMVKDINPAMQSASSGASGGAYWITVIGTTLFFWADDGTHGQELWTSDGTAAGTVMVKDIRPGFPSSQMGNLMVVGTTLYFSANDGTHGKELWKSDGTTAGTVMVKDINSGYGDGYSPTNAKPPTAIGTTIYFRANDGIHGDELWKSDGTAAGTVMVKDVNTGPDYSTGNYQTTMVAAYGTSYKYCGSTNCGSNSKDASLNVIDDVLYFTANDGIHGDELWTSDGTAAGTVMVADINSGAADAFPRPEGNHYNLEGKLNYMYYGMSDSWYPMFAVLNDVVFFAADDGTHGLELYALRKSSTGTYSDDNGGSATGRTCKLRTLLASVHSVGSTGATFSATSSDDSTVYYVTLPKTDAAPLAGAIKDQSVGTVVGGKGTFAATANTATSADLSGLVTGVEYVVYAVVVTAAGNFVGAVVATEFTPSCDVTDCGQCSEAGKCDECQNSKFLAVDTVMCTTECPVGTYSDDNGGVATGRKCMPCSAIADCGKCSVAGLCDECASSKFLDVPTKTCPTVCPDGSYGDDNGGAATGRTCTACDVAHCGKCSKSGECNECQNSRFLAADKTACLDPCPGGSYGAGTGETGRTCVACDVTDCGQCSETGKCQVCENSTFLSADTTTCPVTCPVQFYGVGSGEIGRECKAQATCGNANTASAAASPVSDADCGVGFIADADAASATLLCAGGACDPTNVAADKAACCVALSTCGDKNGAAAGTDAVSDSDCGDGAVYKIESASTTCRTFMCDVSSTVDFEGDKASCCMKVGTCSSVTDSMCGNGFIYNIANPKVGCAGATCDPINVPADKTACCVPQATCGAKPVTSDDCGANFVFKDTSGGSLCAGVACSPSTVTADRDACCVVENCVVGSTWSAAGTAPCALCKKATDCVHGAASACDATTNLVCKLSPPTPCVAGSTWSATGAAPCGPCKKASGCVHGMSSSCDPGNDLVCTDAPPPCVAGSTYSVSGKEPCALCRKAAECVHGTRATCDAYSNLICKVPPPTVACVAGSTWSSTSNAPCAICKQASECAHGIMYRCDPANDLECNDAPLPCVAGSTYSVSGAAPCGDCKQASDCIHGSVSNCSATKNRVCADSKNAIIDGGGGAGGATNDTTTAVVPPPLNRKPTVQPMAPQSCSGTPFDWPCWWWVVAMFLVILLILLIICCSCFCCPCCVLWRRRHQENTKEIHEIVVLTAAETEMTKGISQKKLLVTQQSTRGWAYGPTPASMKKQDNPHYKSNALLLKSVDDESAMVASSRGGRGSIDVDAGGLDDSTIDVAVLKEGKQGGGFIKLTDPETGRPFYFNEATGESVWHAPKAGFKDATKENITKQRRKTMTPKQAYRVTEQTV